MSKVNPAVTGAWLESHDPGDRQFLNIGDLTLESGEVLPDVVIAYQSWGKLNPAGDNAVLVNHALTGWADVNGWWPQMVGPGLPFDTDKFFCGLSKCNWWLPRFNWSSIPCTRWEKMGIKISGRNHPRYGCS